MSTYFLDTSALVKRYLPEPGTLWIRGIIQAQSGNDIAIVQITPIEVYSALTRNYHDGRLTLRGLQGFRRLLMQHLRDEYNVIIVTDAIVQQALDLQERHRLRAYDATQLAAALTLSARLASARRTITFLAADTRLLQAADTEGLTTDNPNNYT
jgi:uncharacterized protein